MAADLHAFRTRFPDFDCKPDHVIGLALEDAALQINRRAWGRKADLGTLYLAAHMMAVDDLALAGSGGAQGAVLSETVGSISRTYASPGATYGVTGEFGTTKYGLMYMRLKSQVFGSPVLL